MADFHFVEDYEAHVEGLLRQYPIDKTMELAVGGAYEQFAAIESNIIRHTGIQSGMSLLDLGCGSGRLASALGNTDLTIDYTGIDIVQSLLDYAATKSPKHFLFILNRHLYIPLPSQSFDSPARSVSLPIFCITKLTYTWRKYFAFCVLEAS